MSPSFFFWGGGERGRLFYIFSRWLRRGNQFPDDKNLILFKLKAFANDKINVTQIMISVFDRVENIKGKGENAGYQHFPLFPQCF